MSERAGAPVELAVWMYHYVRDTGDAAEAGTGIAGLPVARFAEQLDDMARHNQLLGWPDVRDCLLEGEALPSGAALLTFDDGVCDHYLNVYPLLKDRGVSGLFFGLARTSQTGLTLAHKIHFLLPPMGCAGLRSNVYAQLSGEQQDQFRRAEAHYQIKYDPTTRQGALDVLKAVLQRELAVPAEAVLSELFARHVGDELAIAASFYLQPAQIGEMAAGGMHFGGHSANHPWFDTITREQQAMEIAASAAWLSGLDPGPWAFAYPYGGFSPEAPRLLAERGFAAAFTTRAQLRHRDPFYIGRLDGEEFDRLKSGQADG